MFLQLMQSLQYEMHQTMSTQWQASIDGSTCSVFLWISEYCATPETGKLHCYVQHIFLALMHLLLYFLVLIMDIYFC